MIKQISLTILFILFSLSVQAKQIADVKINEQVTVADKLLTLNGAGMRTKFVFDIYVAAFYTADPVRNASQISDNNQPMRMAMHFVYGEVGKEKLTDGWDDGFEDNLSSAQLKKMESRIKLFNGMFETVKKGDVILLDYIPAKGTLVTINDKTKGVVTGFEFYQALLMIWLGDDPVGDDLKDALLGKIDGDDD
ncbi:MAG: chalcone isomerase family protein [Gammaproteobacteria bacterium]|nr:chalcone isomerase family protein [Gammaproteobacteria bacterium]